MDNDRYSRIYDSPARPWDEIAPRLWMGGYQGRLPTAGPELADFDHVVSFDDMVAREEPAGARATVDDWTIADARMPDVDRLVALAARTHQRWQAGALTLVRCAAGQNRSALLVASVLILEGHEPLDAIRTIRSRRHVSCLHNNSFVDWLIDHGPDELVRQ